MTARTDVSFGGSVANSPELRLAARSDFASNADITVQNLTITCTSVRESPCGTNITFRDNTLIGSSFNVCSGSNAGGNVSR